MCGIYACLGNADATAKVLAGLKRIEYRGYDSWGIAICNKRIEIEKHIGKISEVKKLKLANSSNAIGHTRWATHGGVTEKNAHPHLAKNGHFSLVQNGVLENYQELKSELQKNGYKFQTQTDTEVIVALLEKECQEKIELKQFAKVIKKITGRNTILLLTKNGEIWAYRQGSPLIVGQGEKNNYFFSSDLASMSSDGKNYYVIENQEIIHFDGQDIKAYQVQNLKSKKISFHKMDQQALEIDKGNYAYFMLKEIYEQQESLTKLLNKSEQLLPKIANKIESSRNIYVVGAGSASYAALSIVNNLRKNKQHIYHVPAYDYIDFVQDFSKQDLAIVLSQSGETADTIEAVEQMQSKGVFIVSVVNMPASTLTKMADLAYPLNVGAEVGVASTKALTAHMLFGMALSDYLKNKNFSFKKETEAFAQQLIDWFADKKRSNNIKKIAKLLSQKKDLYVLGRGSLLASTLEFALKIKEVSYLHAEGFSAGELKHGVIALIEKETPVICLLNQENRENMLSSAHEVKARGAKVIGVATRNEKIFDLFIELPKNEKFINLSSIIVAQLLTYEIALLKKLNPDKPRNLAKSVTVK
jgi:glucosamine--fructose-6-phosphate aminotransferase (isomerizing)